MKKVEVVLVGTLACKGTEKTRQIIEKIISENKLFNKVDFKTFIYTGFDRERKYPIYGSPTVLINGKDLVFKKAKIQESMA